jgi:hypothetical protein
MAVMTRAAFGRHWPSQLLRSYGPAHHLCCRPPDELPPALAACPTRVHVTTARGYSVTARRTSYQDLEVTYIDGDRRLRIDLGMAGDKIGGWTGVDTELYEWTEPAGIPLTDADRALVRARLDDWAAAQDTRVRFGPPMDWHGYERSLIAQGYRLIRGTDSAGRTTVSVKLGRLRLARLFLERLLIPGFLRGSIRRFRKRSGLDP